MKRDSHEHLLPSNGFFWDYGIDVDGEIDESNIRHRHCAPSDVTIDHDAIVFGTTFVFLFCLIATLIITSVETGLAA